MIFGDLGGLGDLVTRNARLYPERAGLVFRETRLTWRAVNDRVNRLANAFLRQGLRPGERLAILARNSHRFLEAFFAATKTGLIAVKPNYRYAEAELSYILNDCQTAGLVFDARFAEVVAGLSSRVPSLRTYVCTDQKVPGALDYEALVESSDPAEPPRDVRGDDLAMIQYTSGTTREAKGAMMTHRGQILLANNGAINLGRHVMLIALPLFAAAATGRVLSHVYLGNTIVILPAFEPRSFMETLARERVSLTGLVPSMFYILMEKVPDVRDYDTSSLRRIVYGGSPMTVSQLKVALKLFAGCGFEGGYGLTETGPYGSRLLPEEHKTEGTDKELARLGSVGRMAINGLLKVVAPDGAALPPCQIGEVAIYCDSNMIGYWNKPQETAETLRDGWVMTGDLGELDEDGYLYIRDRAKDLIISGGFNIFPREIEDHLNTHPAVREAAVIGVPDEKWGESVLACVLLKDGADLNEQECIDYCRSGLAGFKKPRRVVFVDEFPRSPMGKIQKHKLREVYWAGSGRKI